MDLALKSSTAKWKIVVGHHTIKSAGHHGVTEELVVHLLPILEVNKSQQSSQKQSLKNTQFKKFMLVCKISFQLIHYKSF